MILFRKIISKSSFDVVAEKDLILAALVVTQTALVRLVMAVKRPSGAVQLLIGVQAVKVLLPVKVEVVTVYASGKAEKCFQPIELHPWLGDKVVAIEHEQVAQLEILEPSFDVNMVQAVSYELDLVQNVLHLVSVAWLAVRVVSQYLFKHVVHLGTCALELELFLPNVAVREIGLNAFDRIADDEYELDVRIEVVHAFRRLLAPKVSGRLFDHNRAGRVLLTNPRHLALVPTLALLIVTVLVKVVNLVELTTVQLEGSLDLWVDAEVAQQGISPRLFDSDNDRLWQDSFACRTASRPIEQSVLDRMSADHSAQSQQEAEG